MLGKRAAGEANLLVYILTEELGLVRASVRAARREDSKLRYGLEPMTLGRYSFVRGKQQWRLTGVLPQERLLPREPARRAQSGKVAKLLLRLLAGEERVPELLAVVAEGLRSLAAAATKEEAEAVECVLVLRIVARLGYLPHTEALAPFIDGVYSVELSAKALSQRALLVRTINESLIATGL